MTQNGALPINQKGFLILWNFNIDHLEYKILLYNKKYYIFKHTLRKNKKSPKIQQDSVFKSWIMFPFIEKTLNNISIKY